MKATPQMFRKLKLFTAVQAMMLTVCMFSLKDAKAQLSNLNTLKPTGAVSAIVQTGNYTYLGGNFNGFGTVSGRGVKLTTTSPVFNTSFPYVNNHIASVIPDGSGGWYIGGDFTQVGDVSKTRIAHILSTGAVDASFSADANGYVYALILDGSNLYITGSFVTIGGQSRKYFAKADATTGAIDGTWNPGSTLTGGSGRCIAINGTDIYVGGFFTAIGGQTRNYIAKLNNTNGNADATWDPSASDLVYTILTDGSNVYAGGNFTTIGGQSRNRIAKLNMTTGAADASWNADANNNVAAMALNGSNLYAAGSFTSIGGQTLSAAAKLNLTNGNADASWAPNPVGIAYSIAVNGTDAYIGGALTGSIAQNFLNLIKVNNATGAIDATWIPNPSGIVSAIGISGSSIYAGGSFDFCSTLKISYLARINSITGKVDSNWNPLPNSTVSAIVTDGTDMYIGGNFTTVGGVTRSRLAKLDVATGAINTGWTADASLNIRALLLDGSDLYAGGDFTSVNSVSRNRLAKIATSDGTVDANWNPNAGGSVYTLAMNGTDIYAGGAFTTMGGSGKTRLAKISSTGTGTVAAWAVSITSGTVNCMAIDGTDMYFGGTFTTVAMTTRNRLAKVALSNGNLDSWNGNANSTVNAIAVVGTYVYAGGAFTSIDGSSRPYIARLSTDFGNVSFNWSASANATVNVLYPTPEGMFVGGTFTGIGGSAQYNIARLSVSQIGTWTGAVSNDWNNAGNWSPYVVPTSGYTVTIPSGTANAPSLGNTSFTVTNFTQNAGQTLNIGSGNMNVTGNFTNNGTIIGTGTVALIGATTQDISGTGTVSNLELNSFGATVTAGSNKLNITGLLTLTSGTLTTNDNVVLKSTGPTATAMVGPVPASGADISGNVVHERYLSAPGNGSGGRSWRLLTSPLGNNATDNSIFYHWQNNGVNDGSGVELFSPAGTGAAGNGLATGGVNPSIRSYDYASNSYQAVTNTKTTLLFDGTKNNTFFAFVPGSYGSGNITSGSGVTNADATGTLITGTQNYSFTAPNATNIYYLMGNPYACPIDFDKVYNNTGTANIARKFWVIDPNLSNVGAYATVSYVGSSYVTSTGSQNQYIQTGQGFFVEATTPNVLSTIAVEENDKETAAAQTAMFRTNGGNLETFRVKLYKNINSVSTLLDGTVVAGHQTNSNAVTSMDGTKFGNFNENIGILTAGKVLAIDARQLLDNNDTVHVTLSSMQQTAYQLVIEPGNMAGANLGAVLIDNFTNTVTPVLLNSNTTYSFTVNGSATSTGTNRFKIAFTSITPLSIKFMNTSAVKNGDKIDVQWTVAGQDGIRTYDVERSSDAKSFTAIGSVTAGAVDMYSYTDEAPVNGNNYYRIKAIARSSNNGVYSNIVRVNMNSTNAEFNAYPNPVKNGQLQISVANLTKGSYAISLYNAAGQKAATKKLSYEGGSTVIEMNIASLTPGIYMMNLANENGETIGEQKIVKQ